MELECGCAQEEGQSAVDLSSRVNQTSTEKQYEVYILMRADIIFSLLLGLHSFFCIIVTIAQPEVTH